MQKPVYLDNNATTPLDPRALEAMMPFLTGQFGNASSSQHVFGWLADEAVSVARWQLATLINAFSEEIYFTSGATESVNLAIKGVAEAYQTKGRHMVCLETEHRAVLDTHEYLKHKGWEVTLVPVKRNGMVNLEALEASLRPDTVLVSAMLANNETGVIQPVAEIARICTAADVLFLCDASQAAGKMLLNVKEAGIPLLALSAHKMYGPKGIGALYLSRRNPRVSLIPQQHGGGHESGKRSGTLNVPGIAGFGKAAEIASQELEAEAIRLEGLRNSFEARLLAALPGLKINGMGAARMPHVSNLMFPGISGAELMTKMPMLAVAAGSACSAADETPSHVLKAMGLSEAEIKSSLRFSFGRFNTADEMEFAALTVIGACGLLTTSAIRNI